MKKFTMLLSLAGLLFVGCQKDDDPVIELSVSDTPSAAVAAEGDEVSFKVNSNTDWTVTSNADWAVVAPAGGRNEGTVTVAVAANEGDARTASIRIEADGAAPCTVTIEQSAGEPEEPVTFTLEWPSNLFFDQGEEQVFAFTATGNYELVFHCPVGWKAEETEGAIVITAPGAETVDAQPEGTVEVEVYKGEERVADYATEVRVFIGSVVTFETVPAEFLAGPTAYGENLYPGYEGGFVDSYTNPATGLNFNIPYDLGYGYGGYMLGGSAISQWNDRTTAGYTNQCSVWYSDPSTGKGGHGGSPTFAVVFAAVGMGPDYPTYIEFEEGAEKTIDHLYISNATYAYLSMRDGDAFAKQFTYEDEDWFKLTFQGYDAAGEAVGTPVEYYLADFRTENAGGIVEGWNRIDLSALGDVNRVVFSMTSSDGSGNMMNTPAYFCLDDIAVRM